MEEEIMRTVKNVVMKTLDGTEFKVAVDGDVSPRSLTLLDVVTQSLSSHIGDKQDGAAVWRVGCKLAALGAGVATIELEDAEFDLVARIFDAGVSKYTSVLVGQVLEALNGD